MSTITDALNALCTPLIKCSIPGTNFKNLNDLKTRITLNTNKKLMLVVSIFKMDEISAGTERATNRKSNLFQFDEKYCLIPNSRNFTIISTMNSPVIVLSIMLNSIL